ncbi:low molecular weight phosphotyrosine protein phosphatase-like isoform X2 [Melanaphis sacchari]|nr:low molecular weight phosphotyrosine protein phosphatase-like isoform X2 [Melanaphis sacchari]
MAEAVFNEVAMQKGVADKWYAESSGTGGWHVGCSPDQRTMTVLRNNGINFKHAAQQFKLDDLENFDFVFGMDKSNVDFINRKKPSDNTRAKILMLGSFDPEAKITGQTNIEDPYYDSDLRGFEKCFQQCMRSCQAFLDQYE